MRSEHQVLTPESVDFVYELGGLGSRMLAALVDLSLLLALFILAFLASLLARFFAGALGSFLGPVLVFIVLFGYFTVAEWKMNGQTPGKRLLNLRVIDERGFSIDLFQAVIRNLLRLV